MTIDPGTESQATAEPGAPAEPTAEEALPAATSSARCRSSWDW
jgi:hypothetical protein